MDKVVGAAPAKSFLEAVKTVFIYKYFDFNGRASRSEYWWTVLVVFPLSLVVYSAFHEWWPDHSPESLISKDLVYFVVALPYVIPCLTLGVRRLHDIGRSGWWFVVFWILQVMPLPEVSNVAVQFYFFALLVYFFVILWWLTRPGSPEENKWG